MWCLGQGFGGVDLSEARSVKTLVGTAGAVYRLARVDLKMTPS
jgi:hypothetical protein